MKILVRRDAPAASDYATAQLAWELSEAKWKLGALLPGAQQMSELTIAGGDLAAVATRLASMRAKAAESGLPARILSCCEAGFEGHWSRRRLESRGVVSHEVDPSRIEVNRRARRAKTARIDLARVMRAFLAHLSGEPLACSTAPAPSPQEEDDKRLNRERERLLKERTARTNRIKALLQAQGIRDAKPLGRDFLKRLAEVRAGDGRAPPPRLAAEIARERERLILVDRQIAAIAAETKRECAAAAPRSAAAKATQLARLKGVAVIGAQVLVKEAFYRRFANRRQVGGSFGLVGTPFDSGEEKRDQGVSKAGNRRARVAAIERAWRWVVWRPDSALTRWFKARAWATARAASAASPSSRRPAS